MELFSVIEADLDGSEIVTEADQTRDVANLICHMKNRLATGTQYFYVSPSVSA